MTRFPNMPLTIMNCGVGGDTAENIINRWDWDVIRRNPTYITLTFGMNPWTISPSWWKNLKQSVRTPGSS